MDVSQLKDPFGEALLDGNLDTTLVSVENRAARFPKSEPKPYGSIYLPTLKGEVVFDNVSFGYKPEEPVLKNVSFKVEPGESVALVGPTGAGKTTIINLLARFYLPSAGKVYVDGYDLANVALLSYRRQLGIVLQDTLIFSGTIRENLMVGKPDATIEELEQAARSACIDGLIESMPNGFDSQLFERGANLSAGQRQLLAFARAILADPRILILDEATSNIDPETEKLIQTCLLYTSRCV